MWEELLDVRPIGILDSFFLSGGDSLLAVRLLAQVEEAFDKRLPVEALLGAATIEQLAALLHEAEARTGSPMPCPSNLKARSQYSSV